MKEEDEDWHYCYECQIKRGGTVPKFWKDGKMIVTVCSGTCSKCKKKDSSLFPTADFDWPEKGKKAIWD